MATELNLIQCTDAAERPVSVVIEELIIAGWTGRNAEAVEKHIAELEAIGVPRPRSTPIFYRVGASLLTTAGEIEVVGGDSSGEVEFVLFGLTDGLWVGVGSDHTDRKVETACVTLSKQMCPKPVGGRLWRYDEVAPHWDRLTLRSWVTEAAYRRPYQEGSVAAMRHPEELMRMYLGSATRLAPGQAMFCGTLAVCGDVTPALSFEIELADPVLGRRMGHQYRVSQLPMEG